MNKALIFLVLAAVFAVAAAGYIRLGYSGHGHHGYGHGYRVAYRPVIAYRTAYLGHSRGYGHGHHGHYYG